MDTEKIVRILEGHATYFESLENGYRRAQKGDLSHVCRRISVLLKELEEALKDESG